MPVNLQGAKQEEEYFMIKELKKNRNTDEKKESRIIPS